MKHKIFISYAHIDNEFIYNQQWISEFVTNLSKDIGIRLGRMEYFDIWFDKTSLHGNHRLTEEIKSEVRTSHIFVMIFSQGYIQSPWCIDELDTFLESNNNRDRLSNIFIIQKENLAKEKKPEPIKDVLGFNFWFTDENDKCRTYRSNNQSNSEKYYELVEDVSDGICQYLEKNKNKKLEVYKAILDTSSESISVKSTLLNQIFLIFNQDDNISSQYKVEGYIQFENEFENELIEFTFKNIYDAVEQESFIQKLVDEFESDITIHFIIPTELFLLNFKRWKYRNNELVKRYHILLHSKDRFGSKIRKYKDMIENWKILFDTRKNDNLTEALLVTEDNSTRFDTRLEKIGVCFKQPTLTHEVVDNTLDMAKLGLWQCNEGLAEDYYRWINGNLCLKELNIESRKCDYVSLLWDDMSLLIKLKDFTDQMKKNKRKNNDG